VVQDNEVSTFFSGGTMHVVLEGGQAGSGSIEPIDDGVKLKVTPKFLSPDMINIAVSAERTSLETSLASVSDKLTGTSFARTSKTKISANLTLEYGQTMVLSGLSDQFKDNVDSKVPGLGDVPVAQYLFRNKTTVSQNRTVLILLTPRRASLTFEDGTPIQAEASVSTANLKSLEKNASWMAPSSNLQAIVSHLSRYQFFNQYRKGDIMLDTWTSESWKSDALEKALEYFYIRYDFAVSKPELNASLN
jgi:type II secretory pathway component GspD/PulD (secretin)